MATRTHSWNLPQSFPSSRDPPMHSANTYGTRICIIFRLSPYIESCVCAPPSTTIYILAQNAPCRETDNTLLWQAFLLCIQSMWREHAGLRYYYLKVLFSAHLFHSTRWYKKALLNANSIIRVKRACRRESNISSSLFVFVAACYRHPVTHHYHDFLALVPPSSSTNASAAKNLHIYKPSHDETDIFCSVISVVCPLWFSIEMSWLCSVT